MAAEHIIVVLISFHLTTYSPFASNQGEFKYWLLYKFYTKNDVHLKEKQIDRAKCIMKSGWVDNNIRKYPGTRDKLINKHADDVDDDGFHVSPLGIKQFLQRASDEWMNDVMNNSLSKGSSSY